MKNVNPNDFCTELGVLIKEARLKKKLKQSELADMVGISQPYLSFIEDGKRTMDIFLAIKICTALKINLKKFIGNYM